MFEQTDQDRSAESAHPSAGQARSGGGVIARPWTAAQKIILIVALFSLVLAATGQLLTTGAMVLLLFSGLIFGVFINGLARWLSDHSPISYRITYLLVVLSMVAAITAGLYFLGSHVYQSTNDLFGQIQESWRTVQTQLRQSAYGDRIIPEIKGMISDSTDNMMWGMLWGMQSAGWVVTGALVIFFVGLYAAYEPDLYRGGLVKLYPPDKREKVRAVLDQLREELGGWILGRMTSMILVGVITAVGLWFLGVQMPITLGVLAAMLTFIPNVGPLLAGVPQVLLALNVGMSTAAYVILFNIALQGFESYLITPIIQRHQVSLPPVLTIAAQLIMGVLFGIIGVMMAAPLVVVSMVVIQMTWIEKYNHNADKGRGNSATDGAQISTD